MRLNHIDTNYYPFSEWFMGVCALVLSMRYVSDSDPNRSPR